MTHGPDHESPVWGLGGAGALVHAAVIALAAGYTLMVAIHRPPLAEMAEGLLLLTPQRNQLLLSVALGSAAAAFLMAATLRWTSKRGRWPATTGELAAGLWPLTLIPVALYALDIQVWLASPLLLYCVTTAACLICVARTEWPPVPERPPSESLLRRRWPVFGLWSAIAAYVVFVSIHTILNHRSLETGAYDLGLQENVLWNILHGDFLFSSLMDSHYLGVHTSLVLLPVAVVYAIFPATETLLVLQTIAIAMAAWPLFLLARRMLGNDSQAFVVGLIWLTHPAVAGGNFYDFHATVFAPILAFSALYFRQCRRWLPFWIFIALLLMVKEDQSILVVLLGVLTLVEGDRRRGWSLVITGVAAYIVLQHGVIPYFAGQDHSYTWYYTEMIPYGEGPRGLVTTVLLNPIHSLTVALTKAKTLYLFQLFAPLIFLPFLTGRGWLLMSYGLASALFATRPALTQLGFHYALPLLSVAFFAALLALEKRPLDWRNRAITAAVMLTIVTCFHYGMIWPQHNFSGGFGRVDFDYSEADRERYSHLLQLVDQIPDEASVLAGEKIVPHVSRRAMIETERYVHDRQTATYDYILLDNDETVDRLRELPSFDGFEGYETVDRNPHFVLFRRLP